MMGVALKGLLGRKLRAVLTAFAIILGVAMVSGTFVLTDTIQNAFNGIFTESYQQTDAVISGKQLVDFSASGKATVPVGLLDEVEGLPGVEAAAGQILDLQTEANSAQLIGKDGKAIGGTGGGPTFGMGLDSSQPRFNPFKLATGKWPSGSGQVAIDAGTADKEHLAVGDTIGVAALGPARQYTISGVVRFGSVDSIGGATMAVFDVPTAQALFKKQDRFDSISVAAKPGTSAEELAQEIRPLLPQSVEVQTGDEQAAADAKDTNQGLKFVRRFLLAFGGIALFVGAFVIFNTLSITVAQRTREFATLRTLGASRRQVLRAVLLEGFVIGLIASVVGLLVGLGLAKGLNALFVAFGIDLPQAGTVLARRTVIDSLLVGTCVTVLASIVPALRATRVPAISAVREGATLPRSRFAPYAPYLAGATVALSVLALGAGLFASGLATMNVVLLLLLGCVGLFIGVALVSARLVTPLAALIGWPGRRLGGAAGRLASENSTRNPSRTATTAAALMIGLALVTVVAVLGGSLRSSTNGAVENQLRPATDYVVTSKDGSDPFPADAGDAVASASAVELASSVRSDQARFGRSDTHVVGVDPSSIGGVYSFDWVEGSGVATLAQLGGDGAILMKSFAADHDLGVGDRFAVETSAGDRLELRVKGLYDPPDLDALLGNVVISRTAFDSTFPRPRDLFSFLAVRGAASDAATADLERSLSTFPDTKLHTRSGFVKSRTKDLSTILDVLYVLLALSVIVSLFGMVNTLVLSVFERTRELGMLRAVGMTRRQVRNMIRQESVITALIGAALGMPLGIFLAALVAKALSQYGVGLSVPITPLVVFAVIAMLAGVTAAILPARRAARLNVLEALQYE
jgi:putative ABC transport system permease protein